MAVTYTPIATTTLGSAASSYTFSSIPSTYTDLVIIMNFGNTTTGNQIDIQFNGDTGNNYSYTGMYGGTGTPGSGRSTSQPMAYLGYTNNVANNSVCIVNIFNYSNSTTYKTALSNKTNPNSYIELASILWRSTSAITSVTLTTDYGSYSSGTTFTLYGIKAA